VKFLKAIVKAENFIRQNPQEAQKIHANLSKTDLETTKLLWDMVDFDLSLSESLLTTMEGEAKWLIRKQIYKTTEIPDFMNFFYFDALEKVKPLGVQVIR
jgi:sulfonate transport system substrate-binding protein